jgi:DNA-nicking Smr family endonuclease
MSLSDKDREIWRMAMRDVKPLPQTTPPELISKIPSAKPPARDSHIWDLHGMTINQAHELTLNQVQQHSGQRRSVTFITGKSGQMNREFPQWLDLHPGVRRIDSLNGGGAYRVWFKKIKNKKH